MRLFIDSVECPFDSSQRLSLGWCAKSLCDVESAREGVKVTLKIDSTPQSDRIFMSATEADSAKLFNSSYHTARIEYCGVVVHEGVAVVAGVGSLPDGGRYYLLEITGGAAEWAERAARGKLESLPVEFQMELIPQNIAESWSDEHVKFLPVLRDNYRLDSSESALIPAEKILSIDDYHPFVSVATLLKAIIESAGYRLEGTFLKSAVFRSLMISGAYAQSDTLALREKMGFRAERSVATSAYADVLGRVWFSPDMTIASAGNLVDNLSEGECFTRGGCLRLEEGALVFRPLTAVQVGFDYDIRYETDYCIASRTHLTGFDSIYIPSTGEVRFQIANRFEDRRENLSPRFAYRAIVFDHEEESGYKVCCTTSNGEYEMGRFTSRSGLVQTSTALWYRNPKLYRWESGEWVEYQGDWALYDGYIEECGTTEVHIAFRGNSQEVTPSSPMRFDGIYMSGAEAGMALKILEGTSLQPSFCSTAGYGSMLQFADVMRNGMWQSEFMEQIRRMFNMRVHTDSSERVVYIDPERSFYGKKVFDWSDRVDYSKPIVRSDMSLQAHDTLRLEYGEADGEVRRFNSANDTNLGLWVKRTGRYGSIKGEESIICDCFSPTLGVRGQYANAESALLMRLGDRDNIAESEDYVSPRIVRWLGMRALPNGERWGFPTFGSKYPLAAFHLPAGLIEPAGYTLCFENRDGVTGLHTHYDRYAERLQSGHSVTLYMRIDPDTWASLRRLEGEHADIASLYSLRIDGVSGLYTLYSIEDYDPRDGSVKCRFDSW